MSWIEDNFRLSKDGILIMVYNVVTAQEINYNDLETIHYSKITDESDHLKRNWPTNAFRMQDFHMASRNKVGYWINQFIDTRGGPIDRLRKRTDIVESKRYW